MATLYGARDRAWDGAGTSDLYSIDATTGVPTPIGPTGYAICGLAFDPTDGTLYGSVSPYSDFDPKSLITIDPVTGAGTLVGAYSGGGGLGTFANLVIAFAPDGTLYAYEEASGSQKLYTIDKATGALTFIAHTPNFGFELPYAIEIDALFNMYGFRNVFDGGAFMVVDKTNAHTSVIGTIQNGDEIGLVWFFSDAAFDGSGTMWLTGADGSVLTVDPGGNLTLVGTLGSLMVVEPGAFDGWAIAWDDEAKPSPWFTYPDFAEDFDAAPVADAVDCSTPLGATISTDGASEGPSSLKLNPGQQDSWIELPAPGTPPPTTWLYTSFAVYIPSWSDLWDGGSQWDPNLISFGPGADGHPDFYLLPTSPTTGVIEILPCGGSIGTGLQSDPIPEGAWTQVEIAYVADDGTGQDAARYWINSVDSGVLGSGCGTGTQPSNIFIGEVNFGVGHDLVYYVDDFHWSLNARIGPVNLSAAFFNGVGSGADFDACTGNPVSAHPVDDFYDAFESHTLNVSAPGVMSNDILPTTVSLNTGPSHGTLILNSDGSFSYTPDTGFLGVDTWVYNGNGGTATVTITVLAMTPRAIFDGAVGYKIAQ